MDVPNKMPQCVTELLSFRTKTSGVVVALQRTVVNPPINFSPVADPDHDHEQERVL
jgi:hypothetical protein